MHPDELRTSLDGLDYTSTAEHEGEESTDAFFARMQLEADADNQGNFTVRDGSETIELPSEKYDDMPRQANGPKEVSGYLGRVPDNDGNLHDEHYIGKDGLQQLDTAISRLEDEIAREEGAVQKKRAAVAELRKVALKLVALLEPDVVQYEEDLPKAA